MNKCLGFPVLKTFTGEGPYAVAKQRFLAEDYEKVIPACQQEIDAQLPNALRAQARSKAQPPDRFLRCLQRDLTAFLVRPDPFFMVLHLLQYILLSKFLDV
jgi:hypothetical protein